MKGKKSGSFLRAKKKFCTLKNCKFGGRRMAWLEVQIILERKTWQLTPDSPEPDLARRSWKSVGTSGIPGQGYRNLHGAVHNTEMFALMGEERYCSVWRRPPQSISKDVRLKQVSLRLSLEGDDSFGGRRNAGSPSRRKGDSCRPAGYLRMKMLIVWKVAKKHLWS